MKYAFPQRTLALLSLLLITSAPLLGAAAAVPRPAEKEKWTRVTTKNFALVGDASEREMRQVATRLEQFRAVFSRLFTKARLTTGVPTTVVVFKDDESFKPFKPLYKDKPANVGGYFTRGPDMNYIVLTAEHRADDPYAVIFHEYVHLLVKNNMRNTPAWLNEGLAEYYSTFEITEGDRKVLLGKPVSRHVLSLRQQKFLPLRQLLVVDRDSPFYNERSKQGVFYAQSWALVHYFLFAKEGSLRPSFSRYMNLLATGMSSDESFRQAFKTEPETVEKDLREYVQRQTYTTEILRLEKGLEVDTGFESSPLGEADALAYMGDLLLHINRLDEAEKYLRRALEADPRAAQANVSMGLLRMRERRPDEARAHLEQAIAADTRNHLVHFYYAQLLSGVMGPTGMRSGELPPETVQLARTHLNKALALNPEFIPSYNLLGFVNLVAGEQLDETIALLKRAQQMSPGEGQTTLTLAQVYMRKKDFKNARAQLGTLARQSDDDEDELRARAAKLLETVSEMERAEQERQRPASARDEGPPPPRQPPSDTTGKQPRANEEAASDAELEQPAASTLRPLAKGEEQVRGLLVRIECVAQGVVLHVKVGERIVRLYSPNLEGIKFVTYTSNVNGELSCGAREPANLVLATYRPGTGPVNPPEPRAPATRRERRPAPLKVDGEAVEIDFIPPDWK